MLNLMMMQMMYFLVFIKMDPLNCHKIDSIYFRAVTIVELNIREKYKKKKKKFIILLAGPSLLRKTNPGPGTVRVY